MLKYTKPKPRMYNWEWAIVIALDLVLSGATLCVAWSLCSGGG